MNVGFQYWGSGSGEAIQKNAERASLLARTDPSRLWRPPARGSGYTAAHRDRFQRTRMPPSGKCVGVLFQAGPAAHANKQQREERHTHISNGCRKGRDS